MASANPATQVLTGKVRLSYANLFKPKANDEGEEKYSTMLLIPKSDKETLEKIKSAIEAAIDKGKSDKWLGKVPGGLKKPLRDGDEEHPDDETYAGHYFMNASASQKPQVAKPAGKSSAGKTKLQDITDSTEVYSGCYARVSLNFYPYSVKGSKGVTAWLNGVVKVQDGEPLGNRSNIHEDFADEEFDEEYNDDDDFMN